jgi:MOSC domain-containing protein YiiM
MLVSGDGIRGDSWAHPQIHGGPNQVVLLITSEGNEELIAQGYPLHAGALGENLTVAGLDWRQMRIGQRYRASEVLLELTKIRAPCSALDGFVGCLRWMSAALRSNKRSTMRRCKRVTFRRRAGDSAGSARGCFTAVSSGRAI